MPTGYTQKLCEEDVSFEDFALGCARAFGACVDMRGSPADAEIPEKFAPSSYHSDKIKSEEDALQAVYNLTNEEADLKAEAEYRETKKRYEDYIAKTKATRERLDSMIGKVVAWIPPTENHKGMKDFMIEQLESTIKFDGDPSYYKNALMELSLVSGSDWRAEKIKALKDSIEYHRDEYAKEVKRTNDRNQWLADLRKSLTHQNTVTG